MAAAALLASLLVLLSPGGRHAVRGGDARVAGRLLPAGPYAAFTYRVAKAAVAGANIRADLLFLLGVAVVPMLVGLAGYHRWRARHTPTGSDTAT